MTDTMNTMNMKKNPAELVQAIRNGKVVWTTRELVPYVIGLAGGSETTARSRAATIARTIAWSLGVSFDDSVMGRYVFGQPSNEAVVVKVVEKKAEEEVAPTKGGEEPEKKQKENKDLRFPPAPPLCSPNPKFQRPSWYGRMAAALDAGKHVSLAGPPGIGKSTAPEQYFVSKGQPFVVVNGDAGFRRRDIEGTTEIQSGSTFFKVAEFATAAVNGWGCILNEVNAADPDALLFINGILEVPNMVNIHGKAYPVHPDFRLVVTYNPGLIGTKALPQAFKDRFFPIKLGFPNRDFLRRLIVAKTGVSEGVPYLTRLLKYAEDCWTLHEKGTLRYQLSPRRLFDVVFLMESRAAMNLDEAIRWAVIDAVDSAPDIQTLTALLTKPLTDIRPQSQFA